VIGLEETLVIISTIPMKEYDVSFKIVDHQMDLGMVFAKFRPFLKEFLEYVNEKYEIIIFSNGSEVYIKQILDYIEKDKAYFAHRIYGTHIISENPLYCVKYYDFLFTRERTMNNTVIIEPHVQTFSLVMTCGVPIEAFVLGNNYDSELAKIAKFLDILSIETSISNKIKGCVNSALSM